MSRCGESHEGIADFILPVILKDLLNEQLPPRKQLIIQCLKERDVLAILSRHRSVGGWQTTTWMLEIMDKPSIYVEGSFKLWCCSVGTVIAELELRHPEWWEAVQHYLDARDKCSELIAKRKNVFRDLSYCLLSAPRHARLEEIGDEMGREWNRVRGIRVKWLRRKETRRGMQFLAERFAQCAEADPTFWRL